jgi:hypothetical protein
MAGVLPLADGNGKHRAEDGQRGFAVPGQTAQRAVKPSVLREEIVS